MHITRMLMAYVRRRHVPGLLHSGKHQIYPKVTTSLKKAAAAQMVLEQENLEVLSNPYLTVEEDRGHMKEINKAMYEEQKMRVKEERWLKPRLMDEHLDHLNVQKKWE